MRTAGDIKRAMPSDRTIRMAQAANADDRKARVAALSLMVGAGCCADIGHTRTSFLDACRFVWNYELKRRRRASHDARSRRRAAG
jgi:hypothetical protein